VPTNPWGSFTITTTLKRRLYKRGSSYETTIPMPLLFSLDKNKKHNVLFIFEPKQNRWYISFEDIEKEEKNNKVKE
jgi:hypothetical protein